MDLSLTEDQSSIRDFFAAFFEREAPISAVRESRGLGFEPRLWKLMRSTGAPLVSLAAEVGGGGAGLLESAIIATELGRRLAPVPFVEHVVAARLLHRAGCPLSVMCDVLDAAEPATLALRPVRQVLDNLPAGAVARHIVVLDEHGRLLLGRNEPSMRAGSNFADLPLSAEPIRLADLQAHQIAVGADAASAYECALDEWRILQAAALCGLAEQALQIAVGYVAARHQFGVPVGSFQAIQHGLAELTGPISGARLLAYKAAWAADAAPDDAPRLAAMASIFAIEVAQLTTTRSLHYHGGYGAMAEYDIQLYYRRAKGWPLQLGDPARDLRHLADILYGNPGRSHHALRG
jgi:alkylation response protein AidB-like acyl-CoA dehydrogenase